MLVGSHGVLARFGNTAHGAQMIWRKADGECGQRGGGPFCLAFKSLFGCCLIPCDLIPANNWICTTKEPWNCESVQLFLQVVWNLLNCFFFFFKHITDEHKFNWYSNTFSHKQTLMNILIRSWRAGEVEGYILLVSEADWNPATQQMCFYCKSDPAVTFRKSRCRVLVLTSKLSPDNLLHLGCILMHLSQEPWRPSPSSTAQNAQRMWLKPPRQRTPTLMSSITEACAKNWLATYYHFFPDRCTCRCMFLSQYSGAPFQIKSISCNGVCFLAILDNCFLIAAI